MNNILVENRQRVSMKVQTIAGILALVAAVALPQFFHVLGRMSGLGTKLGETFLPMHLPILLVGVVVGPFAGALAGFFAPLVSFYLTAMPGRVMLPFMMIELMAYGLAAGLVRNVKVNTLIKVLFAQVFGRLVRAVAILISINLLGNEMINSKIILNSIKVGIFGLVLQWTFIPLIVFYIEEKMKEEK